MKKSIFLFAIMATLITGCSHLAGARTVAASGSDVSGTVPAANIIEIKASQGISVNYASGQQTSVKYTVPESLSEYLEINCDRGVLNCRFRDGISINLSGRKVVVNVVAPGVSEFEARSAASINVAGAIDVSELEADASSAGIVSIAKARAITAEFDASSSGSVTVGSLEANKVEADASSAGSISVSGTCSRLEASASSGATVDASGMQANGGSLSASSGGSVIASKALRTQYGIKQSSGGSVTVR